MRGWRALDALLAARGVAFGKPTLGQTTGGQHAERSYHYQGTARDYGRTSPDRPAIAAAFRPYAVGPDAPLVELFYTPTGDFWKHGKKFRPSAKLAASHEGHVHAALSPTADLDVGAPPPAAEPIPAEAGGGGGFLDPIRQLGRVALAFVDPNTYRRLGLGAAGALALLLGVYIMSRDLRAGAGRIVSEVIA